jgi:DnaJ-class molecular chaperone
LGIPNYSPLDAIKKAFRELSLKHHPDKNKGAHADEERFIEVTKAYRFLLQNKEIYDNLLR